MKTRNATHDPADDIAALALARGGRVMGVNAPEPDREANGVYTLTIPGWRPALANELMGNHWRAGRLKKNDVAQVAKACLASGVPKASCKRRVSFHIAGRYSTFPDDDAPLKSGLDALKRAGAIVDDSAKWCDWQKPTFSRGPKGTVITLEDVA